MKMIIYICCMTQLTFTVCSKGFVLTCLLQTCSRVLLPPQEKKQFFDQLSRPAVSSLMRKGIKKKIVEKCKKISHCPYCEALNGEWSEVRYDFEVATLLHLFLTSILKETTSFFSFQILLFTKHL